MTLFVRQVNPHLKISSFFLLCCNVSLNFKKNGFRICFHVQENDLKLEFWYEIMYWTMLYKDHGRSKHI